LEQIVLGVLGEVIRERHDRRILAFRERRELPASFGENLPPTLVADRHRLNARQRFAGDAFADYGKSYGADISVDGVGDVWNQPIQGNFNQLKKLKAAIKNDLEKFTDESLKNVVEAARSLSTPDAFPGLWDDARQPAFRQLRENLGTLITLGRDHGGGRRMVHTDHAYNVRRIDLVDRSGEPLQLSAADVPVRSAEIDPVQSKVIVENPYATDEPNLRGTPLPEDGKDDGQFTMTLDQFLRNFDLLRWATVGH